MASHIPLIVDQLQREHSGDPWHGSPLRDILSDVDAAQAARKPIADAHSIWELVLHMTGWKLEVAKRARGGAASEPESGDWPAVGEPTAARWRAAVASLEDAHRELIASIEALAEDRILEPTNDPRSKPLGTGVSYYVMLHGIVQHDVYHAGQIALLKKG
ncbi:MAG TPA: DinB family protein [Vicinamibacterales bacterium]|nr:DinB family protein [Vicinamibacterales bacterium]